MVMRLFDIFDIKSAIRLMFRFIFLGTANRIECIKLLQKEQQLLSSAAAANTISSCRLQQRVVVAYRHFLALSKHIAHQNSDQAKNWYKEVEENIT